MKTTRIDVDAGDRRRIDELAGIGAGDVLVFLPGERDIREAAKLMRSRIIALPGADILPLYARLSDEQSSVFKPTSRVGASSSLPTLLKLR